MKNVDDDYGRWLTRAHQKRGLFILQLINGITFVDAPGIRDTDEDFLNLQPLIQSADAFIFVISTAEHDGVDKDRASATDKSLFS